MPLGARTKQKSPVSPDQTGGDSFTFVAPSRRGSRGAAVALHPTAPEEARPGLPLPASQPRAVLPTTLTAVALISLVLFGVLQVIDSTTAQANTAQAAAVRRFAFGKAVANLQVLGQHHPTPASWKRLVATQAGALKKSLASSAASTPGRPDPAALFPETRRALEAANGPVRAKKYLSALAARKEREAAARRVWIGLPWGEALADAPYRGAKLGLLALFLGSTAALVSALGGGSAILGMALLGGREARRRLNTATSTGGAGSNEIARPAHSALPGAPNAPFAVAAAAGETDAEASMNGEAQEQISKLLETVEDLRRELEAQRIASAALAGRVWDSGEPRQAEERIREMEERLTQAEKRAAEAERRLNTARAERDDAFRTMHGAASAAAAATHAALTARGTGNGVGPVTPGTDDPTTLYRTTSKPH